MLQVVFLYVLGEIVHLKIKIKDNVRQMLAMMRLSTIMSHLYRACHCAEGKHCGTVLYSGLTVERSLSVNKEYSNLLERNAIYMLFSFTFFCILYKKRRRKKKSQLFDKCLPCCHQACQPQRLRSRSEFLSSPSHSLLSS